MSIGPLSVLLAEVSVQILCPFFNWVVCLLGDESYEFFIYFGDQTLVRCIIGKCVFPYSWFPFLCDDEPLCTVGGNAERCSHCGKQLWNFLEKLKMELPFEPVIPLLGIYPNNPKAPI